MSDLPVIEGGAKFRFTNTKRNRKHGWVGDTFEIKNVFIDEDGKAHATVLYDENANVSTGKESVSVSDIHDRIENNQIERKNTGHEAWCTRNAKN